jgi:penicillin-binding protein 1A
MPLSDLPARAARHLQPLLARLRRPTRRGVVLAVAAVPASLLLYSLILIPFTPGISDIRKARLEQPARVLSADGKELAVFKWANREWVGLAQMAPSVKAALIATEDHRFYEHHGIDFYRLGGAALRSRASARAARRSPSSSPATSTPTRSAAPPR